MKPQAPPRGNLACGKYFTGRVGHEVFHDAPCKKTVGARREPNFDLGRKARKIGP